MAIKNNVMIVRQRLLTKLISLWNENQLVEKIDRVPIEFSPRNAQVRGRCCIHKERAVWKYKSLPLLGYDMRDETGFVAHIVTQQRQRLVLPYGALLVDAATTTHLCVTRTKFDRHSVYLLDKLVFVPEANQFGE